MEEKDMYPVIMFNSVYSPASEMIAKKGNNKRYTKTIKKIKKKNK